MNKEKITIGIIFSLIASILCTFFLLVLITFIVKNFSISPATLNVLLLFVYGIASYLGGFILGKTKMTRRIFLGMIAASIYLVSLFLITNIFGDHTGNANIPLCIIICLISGILGSVKS